MAGESSGGMRVGGREGLVMDMVGDEVVVREGVAVVVVVAADVVLFLCFDLASIMTLSRSARAW